MGDSRRGERQYLHEKLADDLPASWKLMHVKLLGIGKGGEKAAKRQLDKYEAYMHSPTMNTMMKGQGMMMAGKRGGCSQNIAEARWAAM